MLEKCQVTPGLHNQTSTPQSGIAVNMRKARDFSVNTRYSFLNFFPPLLLQESGKRSSYKRCMHIVDHGEKIKNRKPDRRLNRVGIWGQIAAFQQDTADIRVLADQFFGDANDFILYFI